MTKVQKILKILKQTFWQIIVKVITTVSGFIILGIVSRTYGEEGTGNFTLALTYLAFFYILSDFGFNAEVLKRLQVTGNRLRVEWQKLLGTRIVWSGLLTIFSIIILFLLPQSFSQEFKWAAVYGSLIILFFAINMSSMAVFQSRHRYDLDILPTLLGVVVGTGIIWYGAASGWPIYMVILGYTIAWFIHAGGTLYFAKFKSPIFDTKYTIGLFKKTWPLAATLFLNVIYFRADAFLISYFHGSSGAGIYNMAYQFFQAILVLPTFIMNAFYPMMLEEFKLKSSNLKVQIKNATFLLFTFSLIISFITYFLSPTLIKIVTGTGFEGSVTSLQILSFGFPAYFLSALLMFLMIAKNMYKSLSLVYGLGLLFNLIANLIFIPQYSYLASAWITGISECVILLLQIIVLLKIRKI